MKTKEEVESYVGELGRIIASSGACPPGIGFALLMFDFGEGGTMAYTSNAVRADMIAALEELLKTLRERHQ